MASLWFACCSGEDYLTLQQEVEARDHGAHIVRFEDTSQLKQVDAILEEPAQGTALFAHGASAELDIEAVADVACCENTGSVVVVIDCLDPAYIAQLFRAGASEIVAAEGADSCPATSSPNACTGEESGSIPDDGPPFCLDGELGASPAAETLACDAHGVSAARAPQVRDANSSKEAVRDARQPVAGGVSESDPARAGAAIGAVSEAVEPPGARAPVICALSGRGGVGRTTISAAMACYAARCGLRAAVLDLDLMFGNVYELFGVDEPHDLESLVGASAAGVLAEDDIVRASMRIAPGLTLWGPIGVPEHAELLGKPVELLLGVLRKEADVVFVDTSVTWTDAVAAAVGECERCLMVCDGTTGAATGLKRSISMASRLGVPRTRMTCVVNRVGSSSCTEETAMRLEMEVALSSKMRISDGGGELAALLSFGKMDEATRGQDAFARSIRSGARSLLHELGCPALLEPADDEAGRVSDRPRLHLPWKKSGDPR